MYFRMQPYEPSASWSDSAAGHFTSGGSPLSLSNPSVIGDVFTQPIYLGFAAPGITRNGLLASDIWGPASMESDYGFYTYENLLAESTFELDLDLGSPVYYLVASNVYLPALDLTLLDYGISGANEAYKLPVRSGAAVSPIAGGVLSVNIAAALPTLQELTDIILCLAGGGEILDCVGDLIFPLLNGAHIAYGGIEPTWDGTGAPDIAAASAAKGAYNIVIENQDPLVDYVAMSLAEIPYRGMVPEAMRFMETGDPMPMDYFELTGVKHVVMAAKTNLVDEAWDEFSFSAAAQVVTDTADFADDVTFDGDDFLPLFDPDATYYDFDNGVIHWTLDGSADGIDVWVVFGLPANSGSDFVAILPSSATSYAPPADLFVGGPSRYDGAGVIGIDLPDGVDPNALNAVEILAYDSPRAVFWSNEFDLFVNHPQP
jgi:hypothetical protein